MAEQLVVNTHVRKLLLIMLLALLLQIILLPAVYAEGRTYTGSEDNNHCTLWNTNPLRWPQTILGLDPMECRRKAVTPTTTNTITCRLKQQYVDTETNERMCIYERGATGHGNLTVAMDKYFQCPRTQQCTQSPGSESTLD